MYIFLLSSQQCNLLLTWYFHSSQWITWQSSSPTARNNQTEAQLITSAPPHSCHLFPFYIVAALTIFIALAWIRIENSNFCSELWTENSLMASVAIHPLHHAKLNSSIRQKSHTLTDSALFLIFLCESNSICKTFLACSFVKLSSISFPHFFLLYLSVAGTKFAYFSLLFICPQAALIPSAFSPHFSPCVPKAPGKSYGSSFFMYFSKIHGTPGCKTTYVSNIPHWLNFLCTLPLQAENYRQWDKVPSSWKQSLDCYIQSIIYTESKDSPPRSHSIIHYQAGHGPLVIKLYQKFSSLYVLLYSERTKYWVETHPFGEEAALRRATYLCFVTHVLIWVSSFSRQNCIIWAVYSLIKSHGSCMRS